MPSGLAVEPLKTQKFYSKQSRFGHMPEVPFRMCLYGPGSSGKTLCLQNMILNHYRNTFSYIAIWSPTARLDVGWRPVFEYMEKEMGQNIDDPQHPCIFEDFKGEDLDRIVKDQFTIIKKLKERKGGSGALPNLLLIADDVADQPEVVRKSNFVGAFVKYRHAFCSCALLSQKIKLMSPTIRINQTATLCFRLRDQEELETLIKSLSAHHGFKTTMEIYQACVNDGPYSFLYVDLLANPPKFYCRFEKQVLVDGA